MNPKLTVITPNYNKGDAVRDCVQSVLSQSFENWELIFVDDGSTDESFEIAIQAAGGDDRCLFLKNTSGVKGANSARNLGIEKAKSEFIIFLDSDDVMTENCMMDRLHDFEANLELDYIVYPMGVFNDKLGDSDFISNIPTSDSDLHRFLNRDIVWLISGPIWRKDALISLNYFDLSLHSQQDYDLHVRALIADLAYRYIHKMPDVFYRQNIYSIPRKTSQSLDHLRQRFRMILRHRDLIDSAEKLGEKERVLLARYILDISQMMRWHIDIRGKGALKEALAMWKQALDLELVNKGEYGVGVSYLHFKHNMMYNRLGFLQRYLETNFRKSLGELIYYPNTTYCNVTVSDYES